MCSPIKAEHERVSDKLKIAQLESQLELLGHAAQQVIGTAHGSFWLGRDRLSVSAYTVNQLRKLVGYEWNEPAGRWAPGEVADIHILRHEVKSLRGQLSTAHADIKGHEQHIEKLRDELAMALSERDAWKKESELLREEKRVAEGKAKQFDRASQHWYAEHDAAQTKLKAAQADVFRLQGENAKWQVAWDKSQGELHDARRWADALNDEANQRATERNEARAEVDKLKAELSANNKRVEHLNREADDYAFECGKAHEERDSLRLQLSAVTIDRNHANKEVAELKAELAKAKKDAAAAEDGREYWLRQHKELAHTSHGLREQVKNLQDANDTLSRAAGGPDAGELRKEVERLREELAGVNNDLDTTKTLERGLREENQRRAGAIQGHQAKIRELNEHNAQLTKGLDKALDENEFLKAKLGKLRYEAKIRADQLLAFVADAKV